MPISRDEIVTTALRLLDESGLAALSLRKVAAELGVSAPTLYWHVADKRTLLDLVAERIVGEREIDPDPDRPWWEWLADSARAHYRALTTHRDAALVVAGNRPTLASLDAIERTLALLVDAGFTAPEAMDAVFGIGHYVLGAALERHAEAARSTGPSADVVARLAALPHLSAVVAARLDLGGEATFEAGLQTMITGLRVVGTRPGRGAP